MIKHFIYIFITLLAFNVKGQQSFDALTIANEKALSIKFKTLREARGNEKIMEANKEFVAGLKVMLKEKDAFTYPFDSLTSMSKLTAPDKAFRLFNWNVELEGSVHRFYCFILKKDGTIIELTDRHRTIKKPEHKQLSEKNWYGAVYYDIIKLKNKQYTLLGWNGKDALTTQKVIEVMTVSRKKVKFGATIFKFEDTKKKKRRFILEYADDAFVSLKYQKKKKKEEIVFSHLSPATPQTEGFRQYYYPDFSYDSFVLDRGKWVFTSLVDARNEKSKGDNNYIDPYDPNNPQNGNRR